MGAEPEGRLRTDVGHAGSHTVLVELENANHQKLDEGSVTFVVPEKNAAGKQP